MASYKVTWEIDIFGEETPQDAARRAFGYMQDVNTTANVFEVKNIMTRETVTVDLGEEQ